MGLKSATFAVLDCETTGLDPAKDQIVEIGAVITTADRAVGMWATLVDPGIPIPAEVSAVHGIAQADVATAPTPAEAIAQLKRFLSRFDDGPRGLDAIACHNAEFDQAFLQLDRPAVCTKRLAYHLFPSAPNHKNQTLKFWRNLRPDLFGISPHRALGDALVTAALLRDELSELPATVPFTTDVSDIASLIEYAESPILLSVWSFGKHKGRPIVGTDPTYISWCLREIRDMSRDMRYTLEHNLKGAA